MSSRRARQRFYLVVALFLITALYYYKFSPSPPSRGFRDENVGRPAVPVSSSRGDDDVEMVVASLKTENITWLNNYLLDWKKNIYTVDDHNSELSVPQNKGREAMVFLT